MSQGIRRIIADTPSVDTGAILILRAQCKIRETVLWHLLLFGGGGRGRVAADICILVIEVFRKVVTCRSRVGSGDLEWQKDRDLVTAALFGLSLHYSSISLLI